MFLSMPRHPPQPTPTVSVEQVKMTQPLHGIFGSHLRWDIIDLASALGGHHNIQTADDVRGTMRGDAPKCPQSTQTITL